MTFFKKILGAAVVATIATSVVASSASAHNPNNYKAAGGIIPALAGPIGAAALFPSTNTFHWTTTKLYSKTYFKGFKWVKVNYEWAKVPQYKTKTYTKTKHHSKSTKTVGKAVVGCIFGSALGAITASVRKASAMGNPPRWRSQAEHEMIVASGYEKQFELTNDEASTAVALCGLGSFALHWQQKAPVVVKARY